MSVGPPNFGDLGLYDILVVGSLVSDISCTYVRRPDDDANARPRQGSSNPARITQCVGGVAHNIALTAYYLGSSVLLVSVIADDSAGEFLLREVEKEGLSTEGILRLKSSKEHGEVRTGQYVGNYNHDKEFLFGMADVKLMLHPETENEKTWETLLFKTRPKIVVLDTTFSSTTIDIITKIASSMDVKVIIEPVSQPRAKDFPVSHSFQRSNLSSFRPCLDMITPNAEELDTMLQGVLDVGLISDAVRETATDLGQSLLSRIVQPDSTAYAQLKSCLSTAVLLLLYIPNIVVTLGQQGCLFAARDTTPPPCPRLPSSGVTFSFESSDMAYDGVMEYFSSPFELEGSNLVSVNGAGDSLVGAVAVEWLAALKSRTENDAAQPEGSKNPHTWRQIIERGQWAALATLQHEGAVSPALKDLDGYREGLLSKMNK